MSRRTVVRCTRTQIEQLVDYMANHTLFANGEFTGLTGRRLYNEEWQQLAEYLKEYGPNKSLLQWKFTWRDLKKKARLDNAKQIEAAKEYRNGNIPEIPQMCKTSQKILETINADRHVDSNEDEMELGEVTVYLDDESGLLALSPPPMPQPLSDSPTPPEDQPVGSSEPDTVSSFVRRQKNSQLKISSKKDSMASDGVTEKFLKEINYNMAKRNSLEAIKARRDYSDRLRRSRMKVMEFLRHT